jgi:hypothetical protein
MKGLVNCNFLPGSARRLELGRACVLLAKVPIALKRAVGLSGPSTGSAPANEAVRLLTVAPDISGQFPPLSVFVRGPSVKPLGINPFISSPTTKTP